MTVLIALIGLNVVVSLLAFQAFGREGKRAETYLFVPSQVARGENGLGMLLAHVAHGSVLHLAFNMLALYSFGGEVLTVLGPGRFLLVYVLAGLGSDLVVYALHRDDPTYRCLGASGSVFGIMTAAVILEPSTSIVMLVVPVPIPGPVFLLGYAIVSLVLIARKRGGRISHEGHLGGAILGLAVTVLLAPHGLDPLVRWILSRL